jgi:hypothetical protein
MIDVALVEALINAVTNNIQGMPTWVSGGHRKAAAVIAAAVAAERERVAKRAVEIAHSCGQSWDKSETSLGLQEWIAAADVIEREIAEEFGIAEQPADPESKEQR